MSTTFDTNSHPDASDGHCPPGRPRLRRAARLAAVGVAGMAVLAACGSSVKTSTTPTSSSTSTSASPSSTSSAASALNALLPAKIRSAGTITVAAYPGFPPNNFLASNNTTVIGVDPSLGAVLGKELGVTWKVDKVAAFSGIIPGLLSGRYDVGMSGITDTKVREKVLTFVDYLKVGSSILVKGGNPAHITDLAGLCGKSVAMASGTIGVTLARTQSTACQSAGKGTISVSQFPSATQAELQVSSGRAAATIIDYTVASYVADHSSGGLQVVGTPINPQPYGIAVPKGDTQLVSALQKAVQMAISNGSYAKVLAQWGVSSAAVTTATVNGAVS